MLSRPNQCTSSIFFQDFEHIHSAYLPLDFLWDDHTKDLLIHLQVYFSTKFHSRWRNLCHVSISNSYLIIVQYNFLECCLKYWNGVCVKCVLDHVSSIRIQDSQHMFMKGRSTVTQLLCYLHKVGSALDKGNQTNVTLGVTEHW